MPPKSFNKRPPGYKIPKNFSVRELLKAQLWAFGTDMGIVGRYEWYNYDHNFPWHKEDVQYYEDYHNMKAKEKKEFNA